MGYSASDAAWDAHMAEQADVALGAADDEAQALATDLSATWATHRLRPNVTVRLTAGGDDEPLFVFSIDVELADDLAAEEYPLADMQQLAAELRARVAGTSVDDWSWMVDVGTKARRTYA